MQHQPLRKEIVSVIDKIHAIPVADTSIVDQISALLEIKVHILPIKFEDLSAKEFLSVVAALGSLAAPLALSFSMHLYTLWGLTLRHKNKFGKIFVNIEENNCLLGSLNEPGLYFTAPGTLPIDTYPIRARRVDGGYVINGIKKFVSLEPFVSYLPVYCAVENYRGDDLGVISLLINKSAEGVSVIKDWNSAAMQETFSNSVSFENVLCSDQDVICGEDQPIASLSVQGYLFRFNVSSVYLGISRRAVELALETAKTRRPPNSKHVLAKYPGIQFSTAEALISLEIMESQMSAMASMLDNYLNGGREAEKNIARMSLITKEVITREADSIVSNAMKITGINSLSNENPLSSIFKDIKAAQFHPPQQDVARELIAKEALGVISYKQRWL